MKSRSKTCKLKGCENTFTPDKKHPYQRFCCKWHSEKAMRIKNRREEMNAMKKEVGLGVIDDRTCLRCGEKFESQWVGNRICENCA
jgi:hypothetical protein